MAEKSCSNYEKQCSHNPSHNNLRLLDDLFLSLAKYTGLRHASSDDWSDKLNHVYTVLLLILSSCVLLARQYLGSAISCWNPGEADESHHITYAENYCWVSDTFVVDDERFAGDGDVNKKHISYYQWVPFILIFQAFLFKLPNLIWRIFSNKAGINLEKIVSLARDTQFGNYADREKLISHIAHYMNKWLTINESLKSNPCINFRHQLAVRVCLLCNRKEGTLLTGLYLFSKILFFTNVIGQFFILDKFLWPGDSNGWDVVVKAFQTGRLEKSTVFPRVTFCDFKVRTLGKLDFRMQCVLPINMFNEKIFLMFWLWFFFVSICTGLSLLLTIYLSMCKKDFNPYVNKYLHYISEENGKENKTNIVIKDFTVNYLKRDGIFVMKVIGRISTDIVVVDLMEKLWYIYNKHKSKSLIYPTDAGTIIKLDSLFQSLAKYTGLRHASSDDWSDKLNHVYTVLLLILSACVLLTRQYVGSSISCWNPGSADKSHHITYAENYCWVSDTFEVEDERFVGDQHVTKKHISYYQWVPFILIFQAFLFKLPNLMWRVFSNKAGINLEKIVSLARDTQFGNYADKEKTISHIAHYMNKWLNINEDLKTNTCTQYHFLLCSRKKGNFLTTLYVFLKVFFFINVIGQFFILDKFLWPGDSNGWDVVVHAFKTGRLNHSSIFPRVTFCDFKVRTLGKLDFRMQCVLPINMFNEKIFLMSWLWFFFVAICSAISLLQTIYVSICKRRFIQYVEKYLHYISEEAGKESTKQKAIEDFTVNYLKRDGIFIMKVIGRISTDIVVIELIEQLWYIKDKTKPKISLSRHQTTGV